MNLYLFLLILAIPLLILFWISYLQIWTAGWTPTWKKDAKKIIELADIEKEQKLFDLGCGDGRFLLLGAQEGAKCIGIEMDPIRYLISKIRTLLSKHRNQIKVRYGNFFNQDLSNADVVIIYLSDKANEKLKPKLENELKHGARVLSYTYDIPSWRATEKINGKRDIYLFKIPESL